MTKEKPFYIKLKDHRESLKIDLIDVANKTNINLKFLKKQLKRVILKLYPKNILSSF